MTGTKIVGLGGSLREPSRSRAALEVALDGAARAGATVELLDRVRDGFADFRGRGLR